MRDRIEPNLIEPCVMTQTFCDGLASIEITANGLARLIFFVEQRDVYEGQIERHVVDRLVIPQAALTEIVAKILSATDDGPRQNEWPVHLKGGHA